MYGRTIRFDKLTMTNGAVSLMLGKAKSREMLPQEIHLTVAGDLGDNRSEPNYKTSGIPLNNRLMRKRKRLNRPSINQ